MSFYLCFILLCVSISAEVITLINDENVKCVLTGESVYSAIEVVPWVEFKRTVDIVENWNNNLGDHWKHCDNSDCAKNFDIVTDQRWESTYIFTFTYKIVHYFSFDLQSIKKRLRM